MCQNAEALAMRIEEGAAVLAAFAEGLSKAEWRTRASATDGRTIGQVVHHVALLYPVEIELARAVADGKAVDKVTWEAIAEMNAQHAREHANDPRSAVLDLLWRNSRAAADAVREFTDEELSRATPLGLSSGAPVTAQYVIEDHAVRHSWHHLARIQETLAERSNKAAVASAA